MRRTAAALLVSSALAGCLGPRIPSAPELALPAGYSEAGRNLSSPGTLAQDRWWQSFQDRTLDHLAEQGISGNLDIMQALARLEAAEGGITVAGAAAFPSLTLGMQQLGALETGPMRTKQGWFHTSGLGLSSSWMLDLFGEIRSQTDSARALRDAARAGTDIARLAVLSGLASAYVDARFFQERWRIAEATLATRRNTLALTQQLRAQGVASDLDVSRTQETVDAVQADLPGLEAAFLKSAHRLSTLTGQPAATLVATLARVSQQPMPSWRAETGIPADLLRNRPDIRRAEAELASAMADIGVAWAQLFPTITLSGTITPSYVQSPLKNGGLTTWGFGPSLRLPIFDGGRLRANVEVAQARTKEKQAAWRSAVLVAIEEVENALTAYNREKVTMASLQARVRSSERAVRLSNSAYRAGLSSMIEVLDAQRSLYESQSALAQSRRNLALQYVALNVAAGRGLSGHGSADHQVLTTASVQKPAARAK